MKKILKRSLIVILCLVSAAVIAASCALFVLAQKEKAIDNDYSYIYTDERFMTPVSADGVEVITQDVSCGYAVIEMFSSWSGVDITEESLYDEYGRVVTSTGSSFCDEMNRRFPGRTTTMYSYLTNSELIERVYDSLQRGVPVPFEWAALYGDEWTLHYSLVIGMDIPSDRVAVANPYGYYEDLTIEEFLMRTRYEAYEDMPLFLKLGFAFGIFEENTVFIVE